MPDNNVNVVNRQIILCQFGSLCAPVDTVMSITNINTEGQYNTKIVFSNGKDWSVGAAYDTCIKEYREKIAEHNALFKTEKCGPLIILQLSDHRIPVKLITDLSPNIVKGELEGTAIDMLIGDDLLSEDNFDEVSVKYDRKIAIHNSLFGIKIEEKPEQRPLDLD